MSHITLTEVSREVYGNDTRAINRHSEREFQVGNDRIRYNLSRTLDAFPPFFEAYGPYRDDHRGILPRLKVGGLAYWGDGWSWKRALKAFCAELNATIAEKETNNGIQIPTAHDRD